METINTMVTQDPEAVKRMLEALVVPVIMGIVAALIKAGWLEGKYAPLFAIFLGMVSGGLLTSLLPEASSLDIAINALFGGFFGAAATGFYEVVKKPNESAKILKTIEELE